MGIRYSTRETVKSALDLKETARANALIDAAIEAASRKVEKVTNRRFYPTVATRKIDWPNYQRTYAWKLYLDANEVITVTDVTSAGVTLDPSGYLVRRSDNIDEPPYNVIEIDLSSGSSFLSSSTFQQQIHITGTFGYSADLAAGGVLTADVVSTSAGTVYVSDSAAVGVGDLIKVGNEYMNVTSKSSQDTGEVCSDLTNMNNSVTITGVTLDQIHEGEVLTVDSERMLVVDASGTTLTVQRAFDGTVLAAHTDSPTIYAPRALGVDRAAAGTTAATHTSGDAVYRNVPPGPISELVVAYALDTLQQQQSAYARTVGSGEGARNATGGAIKALEQMVYDRYTRRRMGGVI